MVETIVKNRPLESIKPLRKVEVGDVIDFNGRSHWIASMGPKDANLISFQSIDLDTLQITLHEKVHCLENIRVTSKLEKVIFVLRNQ